MVSRVTLDGCRVTCGCVVTCGKKNTPTTDATHLLEKTS